MKTMSTMKTGYPSRPSKRADENKAMRLAVPRQSNDGYTISGSGAIVQVHTPEGKTYDVDIKNQTCTCMAGQHEKRCRHLNFVEWWNEQGG